MTSPFTLSIEPTGKPAFVHGFYLGTDAAVARQIAEEMFHARNKAGDHTTTVALIRDRKFVGFYDGEWSRQLAAYEATMHHTIEAATEYGVGFGPNGTGRRPKISGFYVVRETGETRKRVRAFTGKSAEAQAIEWAATLDRWHAEGAL